MIEYREAEGFLAPEEEIIPMAPKKKATVITLNDLAVALKEAEPKGKKYDRDKVEYAAELVNEWLQIAEPSIPNSHEVKTMKAHRKALREVLNGLDRA